MIKKQEVKPCDIIAYRFKAGKLGIEIISDSSRLKIVMGGALCGVGIITLPIPTGSVFLIGAGCSLMIKGGFNVWGAYREKKGKVRFMFWDIKNRYSNLKKAMWGRLYQNPHNLIFYELKGGLKKDEI